MPNPISTPGFPDDVAVYGDVSGSVEARLRGIGTIWNAVYDSVNGQIKTGGGSSNQGTGNAGGSPWAVSGSITVLGNSASLVGSVAVSGIYAAGQLLGTQLILSGATRISGGKSIIQSVVISDNKLSTGVAMNLVFFTKNPSQTTFTNLAALAPASGDLLNCFAVQVAATDYVNFSSNCVATKPGLGLEFNSTDTNLYCVLVANGAPNYTGGNSNATLQITVNILQVS